MNVAMAQFRPELFVIIPRSWSLNLCQKMFYVKLSGEASVVAIAENKSTIPTHPLPVVAGGCAAFISLRRLPADYDGPTPPLPSRLSLPNFQYGVDPQSGRQLFAAAIHFNCNWPTQKVRCRVALSRTAVSY